MSNNNCSLCWPTCTDTNPCPPPKPYDPCPPDCIYAPSFVVSGDNSVSPCGETGFISFDKLLFGLAICEEEEVSYQIISHSKEIESVSITSNGILFTSTNHALETLRATLTYKVSCKDYATMANGIILFNNPCSNVICPEDYTCNKCTGDCEQNPTDISTDNDSNSNVGTVDLVTESTDPSVTFN